MPKYMIKASYTTEGVKGLAKEGGSGRRAAIKKMLDGLGGTLEAMYYAFGEDDVFVIVDVPDEATGVAVSLAINASGSVRTTSTPLIAVETIDAACKKSVGYRAPGA
jgi:uncharacterized protein with GYD domain